MADWKITFLVTGFDVRGSIRRGRVSFSEPAKAGSEIAALRASARFCGFPFPPERFARATVVESADHYRDAARTGLYEIDRTLDIFAFTSFGQSRYLPIGYAEGESLEPLSYSETHVPMPLASDARRPTISLETLAPNLPFLAQTEHLLAKAPRDFSESEAALAAGLRWCRLGSLARSFSESVSVAFVMEWLALETMSVSGPRDRLKDALNRLPFLMQHWPTTATMNYTPSLRAADLGSSAADWKALIENVYQERNEIFHGREFHVSVDPGRLPSWERGAKGFSVLETVLGRCISFLGTLSKEEASLRRIWEGVTEYVPSDKDCPPTNLGGWSHVWM